jgi:hypothetical protein
MSNKRTFPFMPILFLVAVVFIIAAIGLFVPIQERIDDLHLKKFAEQIAAADRVVVTRQTQTSHKAMSLSFTGEDAQRIIQAVSSGRADRRLDMVMSPPRVTFFHGTNVLAEIMTGSTLFSADGRHYKDGSGVLDSLVYTPLIKMVHDEDMKEIESK